MLILYVMVTFWELYLWKILSIGKATLLFLYLLHIDIMLSKSPLPQDKTVVRPTFTYSLLQGKHLQLFQQFLGSAYITYFCSPMNKVIMCLGSLS